MADNTIDIDILINASQSAKTLKEQKEALKGLREGLDKVKEGSGAFELLTDAANSLIGSMDNLKLSFEDVYGEGAKPLTSQIGELEDRMYQLAAAGQQNTQEFKDLGAEAARLKLAVRDVDEQVDSLSQRGRGLTQFVGAVGTIASGFETALGAAELLGVNTEDFEKTMTKLTATMAVANGLQQISNDLTERGTLLNKALNFVMKQNPIVLGLSAAIAAATAAWAIYNKMTDDTAEKEKKAAKEAEKRKEAIKKANEALKEQSSLIAQESKDFLNTINRLKQTNAGTTERTKLLNTLNKTYGTHLQNIKDEDKFQAQLNKTLEDYLTFSRLKVAIQVKEKEAIKEVEKQEELRGKALKLNLGLSRTQIDDLLSGAKRISDLPITDFSKKATLARNEFEGLVGAFKSSRKNVDDIYKDIFRLEEGMSKFSFTTGETTKNAEKEFKKLSDIFKSYADELIKAEEDLAKARLKENELYYSEVLADSIDYQNRYLSDFKAYQDELYLLEMESLTKQQNDAILLLDTKYNEIINQQGISEKQLITEKKKYEEEKKLIDQTYATKAQTVIVNKNKAIEDQEKKTAVNISKIKKAANEADIAELKKVISEAESNIGISLNVLSEKFKSGWIFPESSFAAQFDDTANNLEKITKKYEKEFLDIFNESRETIDKAIEDTRKIIKEDPNGLIAPLYDVDRKALNEKLNQANAVALASFKDLAQQIADEEGLTLEQVGRLEEGFTNESVKTIENYYKLKVLQAQYFAKGISDTYTESLIVVSDLVDTLDNNIIQAQWATPITSNWKLNEILAQQYIYQLDINTALRLRDERLKEINETVTDEYERVFQTTIAYQEYGDAVAQTYYNSLEYAQKFEKAYVSIKKKMEFELFNLANVTAAKLNTINEQELLDIKRINEDESLSAEEKEKYITDVKEQAAKDREEIAIDSAKKEGNILLKAKKTEKEILKQSLEESYALAKQFTQAYIELSKLRSQAEIDAIDKATEARLEEFDKAVALQNALASADQQAALADLARQQSLQEERDNIEEEARQKKNAIAREQWEKERVANIATAIIDGAVAVGKTMASIPFPFNIPLAILQGAASAAQIAVIKNQPVPEYAEGGILSGPSHAGGGIKTAFGELEGGEAVINKKSTKMFAPLLSAINEAGGGKAFAPQFQTGGVLPTQTQSTDIKTIVKELAKEMSNQPIRAYVNESEITTSQTRVKRLKERNSF